MPQDERVSSVNPLGCRWLLSDLVLHTVAANDHNPSFMSCASAIREEDHAHQLTWCCRQRRCWISGEGQ
jgi:hypothetical protein